MTLFADFSLIRKLDFTKVASQLSTYLSGTLELQNGKFREAIKDDIGTHNQQSLSSSSNIIFITNVNAIMNTKN